MGLKIIISGAIAQAPIAGGGNTWAFLQWPLGFRELGHEVFYVEQLPADRCFDEKWAPVSFQQSFNTKYFQQVMESFGLVNRFSLLHGDSADHFGASAFEVMQFAKDADLFVNLSGRFHRWDIINLCRRKVYVDLDPGFVQIWYQQYHVNMNFKGHDVFFTVGQNLGSPGCPVPLCNLKWHPLVPPVILSHWPAKFSSSLERCTTVADWRGYSPIEWQGNWYGGKSEEFEKIIDLPRRLPNGPVLELALNISEKEPVFPMLKQNGWKLVDPLEASRTPQVYQRYIQSSDAEFSVAKNGYVVGRTGWFSDRTACYLASGKPVVIQDTFLPKQFETENGMLKFSGIEEIPAQLCNLRENYSRHQMAARAWAEKHLDSGKVLNQVLDASGVS